MNFALPKAVGFRLTKVAIALPIISITVVIYAANTQANEIAASATTTPITTATTTATTEGGQTVQLRPDGRWQPANKHRFAVTGDGKRVRLDDDGTWQEAADGTPAAAPDPVKLALSAVEILVRETRRGKGKHTQTRTLFRVQLTNQTDRTITLPATWDTLYNNFIIRSSRGDLFPIIGVSGCTQPLKKRAQCLLTVTAKDSPAWFGVETMTLQVLANTFGNTASQTLSTPYKLVRRRQVDRFDA